MAEYPLKKDVVNEDEGPVGPFPSWSWVYGTVLLYGALVILALWVLTRILDPAS